MAGEDYLYNFYYHKGLAIISDAGIAYDVCIESDGLITFTIAQSKFPQMFMKRDRNTSSSWLLFIPLSLRAQSSICGTAGVGR